MRLSRVTPTTPLRRGFGPFSDVRRGSGAEPERGREFFNERYVLLDIRNCGESQRDSYNQSTAVWSGTADFCRRGTAGTGRSRKRGVLCARGGRTRLLGRSRCFCEGRGAWRRTFRGADRRGFGVDFGGDSIRAGAGASGGGGCGVERCGDERADVAGAAQSWEAERAEGKRCGNAGRECGAEGEKRGAEGTEREGAAERRRGGNAACRSAVRGAFGLRTPGVSLRRSAGERGGTACCKAEKGRSEDSRGVEPSRRGRASAKISGAGIVEESGGVYRCLAARFLLYPSCGALFSGAPPTLVS